MNKLIKYLKNIVYICFKVLMKCSSFETRINKQQVPKFLKNKIYILYYRWWKDTQSYNPQYYAEFQKSYWNTIGQYRWQDSHDFDYTDIIKNINPFVVENTTIIDLGCGKGDMLAAIHEKHSNVITYGIDASDKMCESARKRSPKSTIICGYYGPKSNLNHVSYDIVVARSTVTYIDESEIEDVLKWIVSKTNNILIISEPSGIYDQQIIPPEDIIKINEYVYKRSHDHTHIRDYTNYSALKSLTLLKTELETFNNGGNRIWMFQYRV